MAYLIERNDLPRLDPRLGRIVSHDSRAKEYPVAPPRGSTVLRSVRHERFVPIFDQRVGDCVLNGEMGLLGTGMYYLTVKDLIGDRWNQDFIEELYRRTTRNDPFPGAWEPEDTGTDATSGAKVLVALGFISGFQHSFSVASTLAMLMDRALTGGSNWYDSMFSPDSNGEVHIEAGANNAGGHQYVIDGYDATPGRERIWCANSWSEGWGLRGRFCMSIPTFTRLYIDEQGDITSLVPRTEPAPVPIPVPVDPIDTDVLNLAVDSEQWRRSRWGKGSRRAKTSLNGFLKGRGV